MSEYKPLTCLPVLPLRGIVVFPGCVTHFDVGRSKSARAVEEAMRGMLRRKTIIVPSALMRAATTAQKLVPAPLLMPILARQQKRKLGR